MKKKNTGFSLAEILIALAIISVIATACFSVAKRGIERAYDLYVYTGVKGLTDAIRYANTKKYIDQNGVTHNVNINDAANYFYEYLKIALNGKETGDPKTILAPNNIEYKFSHHINSDDLKSYKVEMSVPSKRSADNSKTEYILIYLTSPQQELIIPTDILLDRIDLLPYYIDNGDTGRHIPGNGYTNIQYYSFREAQCKSNGPITTANIIPSSFCQGISQDTPGAVVLANPRKLRPF